MNRVRKWVLLADGEDEIQPSSATSVHGDLQLQGKNSFWNVLFRFVGPGYLIAVGYMDPVRGSVVLVRDFIHLSLPCARDQWI